MPFGQCVGTVSSTIDPEGIIFPCLERHATARHLDILATSRDIIADILAIFRDLLATSRDTQ